MRASALLLGFLAFSRIGLPSAVEAQQRFTLWDPSTNTRAEATVTSSFLRIDRGVAIDTYTRDVQFDEPGYFGYSNARMLTNQIVRWPVNQQGGIQIGSYQFGRVSFRPARMQIVTSGLPWAPTWRPQTYLGVRLQSNRNGGGVVTFVEPGSLADDVGVLVGDYLQRINGQLFYDEAGFRQALSLSRTSISLDLIRNGRRIRLEAQLAGRPRPWDPQPIWRPPTELGVFGLGDLINGGVTVQTIKPGSVAAMMGIQPGDRIMRINRVPVTSTNDFRRALSRSRDFVEVDLMRFGRGMTLRFP